MGEGELSQWLAQVRLEMIAPMLQQKHVTSIESIELLTQEDVASMKEGLPLLTAKRFQKEFIDKFGPFHSPKQEQPQIEPSLHAPSTSPTRSVSPTPTASQGQAQAHSLHSINGKEVGEFVANTSEDLDQYLDAKRIEHELALEEECLEFLIDIIAQEESPTLYSRCAFDEGAMRRVCLSRDAHTARVQRLRKYRSRALVRERLHPTEDKHEPGTETATARARAARSIRRAKGLRVMIDSRFIFEETDEGQHETPDSPHTHAYSLCLSLSLSLCLLYCHTTPPPVAIARKLQDEEDLKFGRDQG
jgi:hypothetical protein